METSVAAVIFAEVAVFLFLVYGFMHEDKFIRFERRLANRIRARIRARREKTVIDFLSDRGLTVVPVETTFKTE